MSIGIDSGRPAKEHEVHFPDRQSQQAPMMKGSWKERLLAHREDRRIEFEQRLDGVREKPSMSPGDERLQRKATACERKLESLSEELDDRQLEHLVAREELLDLYVVLGEHHQPRLRGKQRDAASMQ